MEIHPRHTQIKLLLYSDNITNNYFQKMGKKKSLKRDSSVETIPKEDIGGPDAQYLAPIAKPLADDKLSKKVGLLYM